MMYTEFEQVIFDRAIKNYQNKHGDHLSGMNFYYKTDIDADPEIWEEFWDKYLNTKEELL
jgi:hypothetical protein